MGLKISEIKKSSKNISTHCNKNRKFAVLAPRNNAAVPAEPRRQGVAARAALRYADSDRFFDTA